MGRYGYNMDGATNPLQAFEVGQSYYGRFTCDYSSSIHITVTKRTKHFIHFELYGKPVKRKVSTWFKNIESVSVVSGCSVSADSLSEDYEHYPWGM